VRTALHDAKDQALIGGLASGNRGTGIYYPVALRNMEHRWLANQLANLVIICSHRRTDLLIREATFCRTTLAVVYWIRVLGAFFIE
jgi:hypothetical protein